MKTDGDCADAGAHVFRPRQSHQHLTIACCRHFSPCGQIDDSAWRDWPAWWPTPPPPATATAASPGNPNPIPVAATPSAWPSTRRGSTLLPEQERLRLVRETRRRLVEAAARAQEQGKGRGSVFSTAAATDGGSQDENAGVGREWVEESSPGGRGEIVGGGQAAVVAAAAAAAASEMSASVPRPTYVAEPPAADTSTATATVTVASNAASNAAAAAGAEAEEHPQPQQQRHQQPQQQEQPQQQLPPAGPEAGRLSPVPEYLRPAEESPAPHADGGATGVGGDSPGDAGATPGVSFTTAATPRTGGPFFGGGGRRREVRRGGGAAVEEVRQV